MLYEVSRYRCIMCECVVEDVIEDDYNSDVHCRACGDIVTKMSPRRAEWVTVAAYETDREYGGPEEGGWYYTTGSPIRGTCREFLAEDFPQVEVYKETLRMKFSESRDVIVRVTVEEVASSFPKNKPRYS